MTVHRSYRQLVLAATCLIVFQTTSTAHAQIPKEAVDAALKGPKRTMMLTASSAHDYAHRIRITPAKITKTDATLVAEGKLVNIVKLNDNGSMHYRITIEGNNQPTIEIFKVDESKEFSHTLKKVVDVAKVVVPIVISIFKKLGSDSEVDLQTVADGDQAAAKQIEELNQKDWKVPCVALISAIAARLQATK